MVLDIILGVATMIILVVMVIMLAIVDLTKGEAAFIGFLLTVITILGAVSVTDMVNEITGNNTLHITDVKTYKVDTTYTTTKEHTDTTYTIYYQYE